MSVSDKTKRIKKKLAFYTNLQESVDILTFALAMKNTLKECGLENTDAYQASNEICEIGSAVKDAYESNRFAGCIKLNKLYFNNNRYKKSGTAVHLYRIIGLSFKKR